MERLAAVVLCACALLAACVQSGCRGKGEASAAVVSLAEALADSNYSGAWELLTVETRDRYEQAAGVLARFGWVEVDSILSELAPSITRERFADLDGYMLFEAMVAAAPAAADLSTDVKSVEYPDSNLAVVILRTRDGLQEVEVRRDSGSGRWLVDLTTLEPPLQEAPEQ